MRLVLQVFVGVALLLAGAVVPALADTQKQIFEQPMKVVIVRSGESDCEPLCPEWIMAEGQITAGTPKVFGKMLQELGERRLPVIIHSPGGSIVAAIQIGYIIRARKLDVAVGRTNYEGCAPFGKDCKPKAKDAGLYRGNIVSHRAFCLSACPLILAAGSARLAGIDATVGVHQWQFEAPPGATANKQKASKTAPDPGWDSVVRKMITDFLTKMDNSVGLVEEMNKAPHSSIFLLDMKRRKSLDLITRAEGAQAMAARDLCAAFPPAAHCIFGSSSRSYAGALALAGIRPVDKAMTVVVARTASPGCEPRCPQWIAAQGVITPETPKVFAKVLKGTGKVKLPILINSPGGDLDATMEIARMIRKRGLDVAVAGTGFTDCGSADPVCMEKSRKSPYKAMPKFTGHRCSGVCTLILASGKQRFASGRDVVKIHSPDTYPSRSSAEAPAILMQKFIKEIGAPDGIIIEMARLTDGRIGNLTEKQMVATGLITQLTPPQGILPADACKEATPPAFCVKRKG